MTFKMKPIDSIDLRTLRVFDAVASCMSFSQAGRQLEMPRAVVSRLIAALEDQLEIKLFRRTTRKVMLTEQGERLIHSIRLHLNGLRDSLLASQLQANSLSGLVRISVSHAYGRVILLPKLVQFKHYHPEVSIHVSLADGIDDLLDKQLDLTIRLGPLPDSALVARSLGKLSVVLAGAKKLLAEKKALKTIAALGSWPTIGFRVPGSGNVYNWVFKGTTETTTWAPTMPVLVVNSIEAVADAVIAGVGIAPVPRFLIESALKNGSIKTLLAGYELPSIPVHLCFTDRAHMPARTRALIEFLVRELSTKTI
jgi:DNA-binding transcriptional LysR family regulator